MTTLSEAFNKTLQRYGIANNWLAEESGVEKSIISKFRNGKTRIQTDTLDKLIDALPSDAKVYFLTLKLGHSYTPNLELFIENISSDDLHDLFELAAERILARSRASKRSDDLVSVA